MRKSTKSPDQIFEETYEKYYVPFIKKIQERLKEGNEIYPSHEEREKIINESKKTKCTFRFIEDLRQEEITMLYDKDDLFPFEGPINNKAFFKLVHQSYLVPYFILAKFAHDLAIRVHIPAGDLLNLEYLVPLPLKLPNQDYYYWYMQKARVLSVNENSQISSHINTYHIEREFMPSLERERRFIGASVLQDEKINIVFQEKLKFELTAYFKEFVFREKHWEAIRYQAGITKKIKATKEAIKSTNKEIKSIMTKHTGYDFKNIYEIIDYLRDIKVLEEVPM